MLMVWGPKLLGSFRALRQEQAAGRQGIHEVNTVKRRDRNADTYYVNPHWLQNLKSTR